MGNTVNRLNRDLTTRVRFESVLADLSSRFVNLEPGAVDEAIDTSLKEVCSCLDIDIAAVWQLTPEDPGGFTMTHLFRQVDGPPVPEGFDAREVNPWALSQVFEGKTVVLQSIDDAPPEAATDRETWRFFDIRSVFCFPLATGGEEAVGAVSFHSVGRERRWPGEIVQRLSLVAEVLGNAIERKRSDAALRESEERLLLAAESAEIGMWDFDTSSQRFWTNERGREIFGYAEGEVITMGRFMESVHPSCRDSVGEAVRRAVEEGLQIDVEYRIVHPNGGERWVHSFGRFRAASPTSRARLIGATIDVTERKCAEDEIQRAFAEVQTLRRRLEIENEYLQREHRLRHGSGRVVGESRAIMEVLELVERVAPTETTVLIQGETGTGKELIAQRVHELSTRSDRPLVTVNCAALPSTLVESELFGREKGAYTGAVSRELGRFEVADGATLLLDEIAELPLDLQPKLLRVLEEGRFERVGSSRTLRTDVRVIAATNRDLEAEVEEGRFRQDLYFRLAVFPIRVPPLRERRRDVPLLVWSIVRELAIGMNKAVETIRREDMESLQRYDWPGNVRELRNVVERALILCVGPTLHVAPPVSGAAGGEAALTLDEVQRRHILKTVQVTGGRIRGPGGAAELLGMKPTTLRSRMQRLGIDPKKLRDENSSS